MQVLQKIENQDRHRGATSLPEYSAAGDQLELE